MVLYPRSVANEGGYFSQVTDGYLDLLDPSLILRTSGDLVVGGDLTVDGSLVINGLTINDNVTLGEDSSDTLMVNSTSTFHSPVIIDSTSSEVFLIRKASDGGDFVVFDTNSSPMAMTINGRIVGAHASGALFLGEAGATSTSPTIIPNKADPDTGLTWVSTNVLGFVAGGSAVGNVDSSGNLTVTGRVISGNTVDVPTSGAIRSASSGTMSLSGNADISRPTLRLSYAPASTSYVSIAPKSGSAVVISAEDVVSANQSMQLEGKGTGSVIINSDLSLSDGKNIVLNTTTGTKLGTAVSQKLGFWNASPVVQQILATGAGATVDNVISLLQTIGLCRQS